jgi:hypothetical protein
MALIREYDMTIMYKARASHQLSKSNRERKFLDLDSNIYFSASNFESFLITAIVLCASASDVTSGSFICLPDGNTSSLFCFKHYKHYKTTGRHEFESYMYTYIRCFYPFKACESTSKNLIQRAERTNRRIRWKYISRWEAMSCHKVVRSII